MSDKQIHGEWEDSKTKKRYPCTWIREGNKIHARAWEILDPERPWYRRMMGLLDWDIKDDENEMDVAVPAIHRMLAMLVKELGEGKYFPAEK